MPRKNTLEFPEKSEKEKKDEEVWDIKKIIIGVVILFLLMVGGVFAKKLYLHESSAPSSFIPKIPSVAGIATGPEAKTTYTKITLPTKQDVQSQIQNIRTQVTHLNLNDIATSSPQVQQIIKQIENLPSGPVGQVKDACIRLCNNL